MSTAQPVQPGQWLRANRGLALWFVAAAIALVQGVRVANAQASLATLIVVLALTGALVHPLDVSRTRRRGGIAARAAGAFALIAIGLAFDTLRKIGIEAVGSIAFDLGVWIIVLVSALVERGTLGRLLRLAGVEHTKLIRSRLYQIGLLAAVLVTLLAGMTHEPLEGETGWSVAATTLGTGTWAAELFLLVLGATTIAGELGQGTLKMILPHAYKRSEWIAAKAIVLLLSAATFTIVITLVSIGHAAMTTGLGDVVKEGIPGFPGEEIPDEVFQTASVMRDHLQECVLSGLYALAATALLGLFFSSLFDSVVPALSAAFLLFLGLKSADVLLGLSRDVQEYIYASYPGQLRSWTAKLGQGLNETWDAAWFEAGVIRAALTGAVAWLFAIAWFSRRDLHG
ncbi:MAG: ABC transporter permease [Planctomycetota bacterium]|nr:ABC transporter permease [Planctomycetota bacterium]